MNNTIFNNYHSWYEGNAGGLYIDHAKNIVMLNNIFFSDTSADIRNEIYLANTCDSSNCVSIAYCNIDSELVRDSLGLILWGPGNINLDPLFADTMCHLSNSSPCINSGITSLYMPCFDRTIYADSFDFDNDPRPMYGGWDIGADEFDTSSVFVQEYTTQKPDDFVLLLIPNPFNSSCAITAPAGADVKIYDLRGNIVGAGPRPALDNHSGNERAGLEPAPTNGTRTFIWTPDKSTPSGIYLIKATIGDRTITKRTILMK